MKAEIMRREEATEKRVRKEEGPKKYQWGIACLFVGAIICMIIGFKWGGWVTGETSQETAEEKAKDAVIEQLAPICVWQFNQDPEKDQNLAELKKRSSWDRRNFIEKGDWATMPGAQNPVDGVGEKCAELLTPE